jgi:FkbM family methyltransferase
MYIEHLVSPYLAVIAAPRLFLKRLLHRDLVSFGLLANLDNMKRRGLFRDVDGIIDIGANTGQFAYMAHTVLPELPIFSFEPDPECFELLTRNFRRFGIPGRCFPFALADYQGEKPFFRYGNRENNSFLVRNDQDMVDTAPIIVDCKTLDAVSAEFDGLQAPFLKIDVQGFEKAVLQGADRFLARCKYVQIEVSFCHSYRDNSHAADILALLRDHGFSCIEILDLLRGKKSDGAMIREADLLFHNENWRR